MRQDQFHPLLMRLGLLVLFCCLGAGVATANSGAPLIGGFNFYLLPWTVGLAVFEAALLWRFYKCRFGSSWIFLFMGNLVSGAFGFFVFSADSRFPGLTIYDFAWYPVAIWLAAYVFSVLIEYPAYRLAMNSSQIEARRLPRSIQACLLIHLPFYILAGAYFLYGNFHHSVSGYERTRDLAFMKDARARVYFISTQRDRVMRCRPDGTAVEEVLTLPRTADPDFSFLWLREGKTSATLDLHLVGRGNRMLQEGFATTGQWQSGDEELSKPEALAELGKVDSTSGMYFPEMCADFRDPGQKSKRFYLLTRWYLNGGDKSPDGGEWRRFCALQSPTYSWQLRNLTVLPGDRLIFSLGDQICALDYPNRRLGLIARGYRPLVVRDLLACGN